MLHGQAFDSVMSFVAHFSLVFASTLSMLVDICSLKWLHSLLTDSVNSLSIICLQNKTNHSFFQEICLVCPHILHTDVNQARAIHHKQHHNNDKKCNFEQPPFLFSFHPTLVSFACDKLKAFMFGKCKFDLMFSSFVESQLSYQLHMGPMQLVHTSSVFCLRQS